MIFSKISKKKNINEVPNGFHMIHWQTFFFTKKKTQEMNLNSKCIIMYTAQKLFKQKIALLKETSSAKTLEISYLSCGKSTTWVLILPKKLLLTFFFALLKLFWQKPNWKCKNQEALKLHTIIKHSKYKRSFHSIHIFQKVWYYANKDFALVFRKK